ncbi:MAG: peptide ABC transporter substrate-binding protein [Anaerolineales bacterium]|nr:peptide ABC transporter substrate-binding protein [Anaerolineales bacterium]MCS7247667.1 peptide ABC transporter substrate-binding protein [Anaerolineales bacterium]MDW8161477.1 peptide ABC transporter substrate-binding protein [Anaerolineales bacterium]MDW8446890.1 peptide ABC transporter substrate-binding protein [Anaerolineales bacterium]
MKSLRWQLILLGLSLILIAWLLWTQQANPTPVAGVGLQPVSGGVYSEALIGSLGRLNPVLDYTNPVDRDVNRLLYAALVQFDERGLPQPDLAESWGVSADGKIYNFSIRPQAVWHDGAPVTSDDIIFTVDALRSDASPLPQDIKEMWRQIQVVPLDEKTIQFRLPAAFAPFLDYLTFGVLPKHLLGGTSVEAMQSAPFNFQPIGSGPFRFQSFISEEGNIVGVSLQAFERYHRGRAYLDGVVFRYYPDGATALNAYRAQEVLGISRVDETILREVLTEVGLNLYTARLPNLTLIFLNLNHPDLPFFQDKTIRRALLMGLNRQRLIDELRNGQAIIADGVIMPGTWAYYDGIERIPFDPEEALDLLKKAGYTFPPEGGEARAKEGVALRFELVYPEVPGYAELAAEIAQSWAKLGVVAVPKAVPFETLMTQYLETRNYHAALVELSFARSPDPDPYPFWDQAQIAEGQNYAQWDDRLASEYLERARITTDWGERARLYHNFQVRFQSELPALPLFYPVYNYAVDASIQNIRVGPMFDPTDRFANILGWYVRAQRPQIPPKNSPSP